MKFLPTLTILPFLVAAPALAQETRTYEWYGEDENAGQRIIEEEYESIEPDRLDEKFQKDQEGPEIRFDYEDPHEPPAPKDPLYEGGPDY
ncbi:hypothetical protein ACSHT0_14645 [Tepidicaulis sp. LMO-SS28]|uniref:hypothetical protein n=1 Tax=Tepidicaulis sp. LMO-SS28 TaxID=3447455 RepID=UPI003EE25EC1